MAIKGLKLETEAVVRDYRLAVLSREASLLGRKEVFGGKAKFGIFGDGKEVAQVALAHAFKKGDTRSGYYRDQTLMLALGMLSLEEFFAQLYAHADVAADPASAGRSMNAHFGTRALRPDGSFKPQTDTFNSSADVSPTGSQMPRLVGLALASRLFRELPELKHLTELSRNGDEIAFGMIGNASCAEGMFWEAVNAIGVLHVPALLSIWDDGYGISVPNEHQITKGDLSAVLEGFRREPGTRDGFELFRVPGWDYPALVDTYLAAAATVRKEHVPAIVHVIEMTQPQGHSTSGSHERYKDSERIAWEEERDCITRMRSWMLEEKLAKPKDVERMEDEDRRHAREVMAKAWEAYTAPIRKERDALVELLGEVAPETAATLNEIANPFRRDLLRAAHDVLVSLRDKQPEQKEPLRRWLEEQQEKNEERYSSHLHSASSEAATKAPEVAPRYADDSPTLRGFEVLTRCFDAALGRDPRVIAFGQDVGKLGDVNQGFAGLQAKYGELRVSDTGIREATILGQGIGMALRGLRPIVEIQYLDYILYCLQIMSDDLASLQYRTRGGQKAPVIIRTRGHRLEGIWHSGSPMAGIINLVRGVHVCVPRDMTRAAGFYNLLLRSDEPGLVIEVLNGYRLKERLPSNVGEFTVPLGMPELLREGRDVTVVTYGACCRIALEAAEQLASLGVEVELIDVQTLLPFDVRGRIVESLRKTARVVFLDEDVPGGASAYMLQQVLEVQGGYYQLDSPPRTISAKPHRPAYGSDGDYFSKPNREQIVRTVYELMHDADPAAYPKLY